MNKNIFNVLIFLKIKLETFFLKNLYLYLKKY